MQILPSLTYTYCCAIFSGIETLETVAPPFEECLRANPWMLDDRVAVDMSLEDSIEVPVYLVRADGIIYSVGFTFTYQNVRKTLKAHSPYSRHPQQSLKFNY